MTEYDEAVADLFEKRYHVPRSQVWERSRGNQSGNVHLHARHRIIGGKVKRDKGQAICSKKHGWYEREPQASEVLCPECVRIVQRRWRVFDEAV